MKNEYKYIELAKFGKMLLEHKQLDQGLHLISKHLKELKDVMRCSIFIYNKEKDELWTVLSDGIEKIIIPSNKGIVGYVFMTGESIIENNVNKNPHFLKEIDEDSGYVTMNTIACPIFNHKKEIIGVLQLLNKLDGFNNNDLEFLYVFTKYISSFIELAPFYYTEEK